MRLGPSLAAIALVLGCVSCGARGRVPEPALPKCRVRTIVVRLQRRSDELASFGTIAFKAKTDVSARVEGSLLELYVAEGSRVKAGARLARLKNFQLEMRKAQAESAQASARSALELAQARLWEGRQEVETRMLGLSKARIQRSEKEYEVSELEKAYEKKRSLLAIGGATPEEVNSLLIGLNAQKSALSSQKMDEEIQRVGLRDEDLLARGLEVPSTAAEKKEAITLANTQSLRAEVDVAAARVESASMELASLVEMLRELELRAPSSGIVAALYAQRGEWVQQNAKLMTIMDTAEVYAVFPIQETDAGRLRRGMAVHVSLDACPGEDFEARLDHIGPIADAQSGAVTVKALTRNPGMRLSPGMFARARVDLGTVRELLLLPASALAQRQGAAAKVVCLAKGKAFRKDVELGPELDGAFVVEKGLRPGEIVVDSPSPLLKEGEDVDVES